jgi:hypothetical protein
MSMEETSLSFDWCTFTIAEQQYQVTATGRADEVRE